MRSTTADRVHGWCPGALRPMESGDGLIVRVKPRAGGLSADTLIALADAAGHFGNGHIDVTRRANLQLRGVTRETLLGLQLVLAELGLLDADAQAEAVRNIMISPLAGVDPTALFDMRPLAATLDQAFEQCCDLWRLPAKFSFLLDGGGVLPLNDVRADVCLRAIDTAAGVRVAVGIDRQDAVSWLGQTAPEIAAEAALRVTRAFLAQVPEGGRIGFRHLGAEAVGRTRLATAGILEPIGCVPAAPARATRIGPVAHGERVFAVGIGVAFGRIDGETLRALVRAAVAVGATELRLSPWRILYLPLRAGASADDALGAAAALGLIVDGADPLLKVAACPGAPACRSATTATRTDARLLATTLQAHPAIRSVHISGCEKGCARSEPADLVLVGRDGRYEVIRHGTTKATSEGSVAPQDLAELLARGDDPTGAPHHG
jgi:precorrin-3B synthase